jgi:CRP/FNR family transcriptional regulator, cyclic AMP receptor protein
MATPVQEQLQAAGLDVTGQCERLSQCPGLMQNAALLQDFSPAEADILGASMLRVVAQPGQVLIAEGDTSDWLMLLLRGTVDVGKQKIGTEADAHEPGDTTRIAVLREGATLGEMSMLDGEPRYASCRAITEVEAGVLTRGALSSMIQRHPAIGAKLLVKLTQVLAQRLRNTSNQLVKVLRAK